MDSIEMVKRALKPVAQSIGLQIDMSALHDDSPPSKIPTPQVVSTDAAETIDSDNGPVSPTRAGPPSQVAPSISQYPASSLLAREVSARGEQGYSHRVDGLV